MRRSIHCVAVVASLVAATAGCTNAGQGKDHKPTTPPPSTTAAPPVDETENAKKEATATYQSYWKEMEKLYGDPAGNSALKNFTASAALDNAEADAKRAHSQGYVYEGSVDIVNSAVVGTELEGKTPQVSLTSCIDVSQWKVLDAKTKSPATLPSTRLTKYVIASRVERWPEGWRVVRDDPKGEPC
ncbi:hypothetical protein [Streptomyces sp. 3211]|uniref:hypothetical protein n=1 Tax=Streptomyces sp. 3211 TaxID=1964449 RepID=UPI001790B367|nr:hypothetical protein [Streptomyces sp. 3211]